MAVEILVVQHGDKVRESGDPGLTDEGRDQAAHVASWLRDRDDIGSVWASPLRRAQETAAPIARVLGCQVQTDPRLRERMNWDDAGALSLDEFLDEWQRGSATRSYVPAVGDSSDHAASRFIEALVEIGGAERNGVSVVVAHGGITVDTLRTLVGDELLTQQNPDLIANGVPCCAVTRLRVDNTDIAVTELPSTAHLVDTTEHRPA